MKNSFRCPTCENKSSFDGDNPWRPFCSERCKLIDLGDWMDESNKIPSDQSDFPNFDVEEDEIRH